MTIVRRRGIDVDLTESIKLLRNLEMTATLREHDCAIFETGARCEAIGESTTQSTAPPTTGLIAICR